MRANFETENLAVLEHLPTHTEIVTWAIGKTISEMVSVLTHSTTVISTVGTGRTESLTAMAFQAFLIAASMLATMKMGIVTVKAFFMRQTELLKHQVCGRITN
jgi:hypothetical protein